MRRRALLAALGAQTTAASVAGCLADGASVPAGGDENESADESERDRGNADAGDPDCRSDEPIEECGHLVISADAVPAAVRCEIDAAFDDGAYETDDDLLLAAAMDVEHAYVRREETEYEPVVERDGNATTLRFREAERLTLREPARTTVRNDAQRARTVTVSIDREDGTVVEESFELSGSGRKRLDVSDVIGRYEIRIETDDGLADAFESRIGEHFRFDLSVADEEIDLVESTADVAPCPWRR